MGERVVFPPFSQVKKTANRVFLQFTVHSPLSTINLPLQMIDWLNVAANSLWIVALALALATLSFARYVAHREGKKLGHVLSGAKWETLLNLSGALFCLGMASTTKIIWKQIIWTIMMVLFLIQLAMKWKHRT
jgi:hypothetical protein